MLPLLERICPALNIPVAALPVPYRTHDKEPTFQSLRDPGWESLPSDMPFPTALDPFTCNRYEIADFARRARDLGVGYFGVCCGAAPHHIRSMAEALGRTPPASQYSPDLSKHAYFGSEVHYHRQSHLSSPSAPKLYTPAQRHRARCLCSYSLSSTP